MRLKMFLTVTLALVACAGSYLELAARCRCDRPDRGGRRAARIERRAARRGCTTQYTPATPSYNPYDSNGVQTLGPKAAAAKVEYRWECNGRSCRLVPIAPQAKVADCPPPTAPAKTPEPEPTKEEAKETPAVEPLGKASSGMSPAEAQRWFEAETAWRPDPPVIPAGFASEIPQLDD